MAAQLTYTSKQPKAFPGLIYALHPDHIDSRSVETAAGIEFGVAVSRGTDAENQCVLGGTDFLGITVRSVEFESLNGQVKYSQTDTAAIMRFGYIWVTLPAGGSPGDAIKYNNTTGVVNVGTAGAGETQLDGATLETETAAGALGVVRLMNTNTTAGS